MITLITKEAWKNSNFKESEPDGAVEKFIFKVNDAIKESYPEKEINLAEEIVFDLDEWPTKEQAMALDELSIKAGWSHFYIGMNQRQAYLVLGVEFDSSIFSGCVSIGKIKNELIKCGFNLPD